MAYLSLYDSRDRDSMLIGGDAADAGCRLKGSAITTCAAHGTKMGHVKL